MTARLFALLIVIGLGLAGGDAVARETAPDASCGTYVNRDGHTVPRPCKSETPPADATALCRDGSYSYSEHRAGTCSGHRGVARWLR